jgi:hypothetical protein
VADPPVEVLQGGERLVLIDGYRRIAARHGALEDCCPIPFATCGSPEACAVPLGPCHLKPSAVVYRALGPFEGVAFSGSWTSEHR